MPSSRGLLHCRRILYQLSHQGSPYLTMPLPSCFSCFRLCDPIDGSPTRLPRPWDSPGKNTGVPFPSPMHESEKWKWSRSVVSDSSQPNGLQPTRLLHPWDFPGKSTRVGCHTYPNFRPRTMLFRRVVLKLLWAVESHGGLQKHRFLGTTCRMSDSVDIAWMQPCVCMLVTQSCLIVSPTRFLCSWNSRGRNTGVGCHSLIQGIFLTQGSNPGLPHCRQILYCLSHQGSLQPFVAQANFQVRPILHILNHTLRITGLDV